MTLDEVRALALALPEATEEPHFDMTSWRVRGKLFATAPPSGDRLHVFVGEDDVSASVAEDAGVFEALWWGQRLSGLRVNLAVADPERIQELLAEAWLRKAPKKLATAFKGRVHAPPQEPD